MRKPRLKIEQRKVDCLKARATNPRTHSRKQIRKIANSIEEFGFLAPILIDDELNLIAGHGRLEAAKLLGMDTVPVVSVHHLTPGQIRAYVIADNELAAQAGWDRKLLALEIAEIASLEPDLDITITGFETEQIEVLKDAAESQSKTDDEVLPPLPEKAVTRPGDLWEIGRHKLLCGDATCRRDYGRLLGTDRADMVITDPPYNVPIAGHVSGLGRVSHREFCMASGEMSRTEFRQFLSSVCKLLTRFSRSGSLHFIFMDWRSIGDLLLAGEEHFAELMNIIVWKKTNAGMGALYRSQHELAALFRHGRRSHRNNVQLGANGRYRTNVWEYPGANSFGKDRDSDLSMHPTVKNSQMIADAIRDVTDRGYLVLDPFAGSGTTLIAAERSERRSALIEMDPIYCDLIIRRAMEMGLEVACATTGEKFRMQSAHALIDRQVRSRKEKTREQQGEKANR